MFRQQDSLNPRFSDGMFFAQTLDFSFFISYNNVVVGQLNLEKGKDGQRVAVKTHHLDPFGQQRSSTERKTHRKIYENL